GYARDGSRDTGKDPVLSLGHTNRHVNRKRFKVGTATLAIRTVDGTRQATLVPAARRSWKVDEIQLIKPTRFSLFGGGLNRVGPFFPQRTIRTLLKVVGLPVL